MENRVEEIESRRLDRLEEQAALYGPQTEPSVLIEIAELRSKRRHSSTAERRQFVSGLDYQFLMDTVAAALVRLGVVEANQKADDKKRLFRQLVHDLWMVAITTMVFFILLMQLLNK